MLLSLLDKLAVISRRDLLSALRYRTAFWLQLAGLLAEMAAFYYLSRAIGPGFRPDGVEYFPFLLVGMGFHGFLIRGVNAFVDSVREAQATGTIEVLLTTATPPPLLVVLTAFSAFAGRALHFLGYLLIGFLLFGAGSNRPNLPGFFAVFLLSLVLAVAIGILAGAVQIAVQKGGSVVWLLGSAGWFLAGTMFPVGALPAPLRPLSTLIPFTHSLDGLRMALLQAAPFSDLARPLAILTLYALALPPLSLYLFARILRRAKLEGTLSAY